MFVPVARRGFHGLGLEMKRTKGAYATPDQKAWGVVLEREGYCWRVCRGWDAAREVVEWYCDG